MSRRRTGRRPDWRAVVGARVHALTSTLPAALRGSPDEVHDARVASRRVREVLALLGRAGVADRVRRRGKVRRRVRRVTRVLGRVREFDAGLALLDDLASQRPDLTGDVQAAKGHLADARRRNARGFEDLSGAFERTLATKLEGVLEQIAGFGEAAGWRPAVARQIARRRRRLLRAMRDAGARYTEADLHVVRIAVKRLRYSTELAAEFEGAPADRLLASLRRVQTVLGRMHDLHVLARHLRDWEEGARFERLIGLLDSEAASLHRDYLASRDELRRAAREAERRFAARL